MRISVFGLGYVGVVSAACLAKSGHRVTGVDVNSYKVELIEAGRSPIVESRMDALVAETVAAGHLTATTSTADAVANTEVSFVCVGTPSGPRKGASLEAIEAVSEEIGNSLKRKDAAHTVVIRSTVPPGTIEEVVAPIVCRASGRTLGQGLNLLSNPEFLREGNAVADFQMPAFVLLGGDGPEAFAPLETIYARLSAPIIKTTIRSAESIKYVSNIFHALKVGFANEIGVVLKSLGVDSREAMRVFCEDRLLNISPAYLRPGYAFGGSCLPKDIRAFVTLARGGDVDVPVIESLLQSNNRHIERAYGMVARGGRRKVALFGLAFKAGTDDLRESPLVALAERLIGKGFELAIFDRHVDVGRLIGANREFIDREIPHIERLLKPTPEDALDGAGVIVIGHVGQTEIAAIRAAHGGRTLVDLQGVNELERLDGADYQGICW